MILNNLGISAAEIDEKIDKTRDFMIYFTWLIKRKTKKPQALEVQGLCITPNDDLCLIRQDWCRG